MKLRTLFRVVQALFLSSFLAPALAQEVSIPDPGLDAAIRAALQKPFGPLTEQDLLSLTNLDASHRSVKTILGLEAARNLVSLELQINRLTNFSLPSELKSLTSLTIEGAGLTGLTLPATLIGLTNLDLEGNNIPSFNLPSNLTSLVTLDLG